MRAAEIRLPEDFKTPCYYYDLQFLDETLEAINKFSRYPNFHVHYALKANCNDKVLERIAAKGLGADCVSGNEVKKAIETGFGAGKVTFAGVGKSDEEIRYALQQQIFAFNVESLEELEVIDGLAEEMNVIANVAIRINPNVDAKTHHYITTGLDENKFGISSYDMPDVLAVLKRSAHLNFVGIHFHVGSQILDLSVFKSLCVRVNEWKSWFEDRGFFLKVINVGGGLGINYHQPDGDIPDFETYFRIFNDFIERRAGQEIHFELGRAVVGQCAALITKVLYIKKGIKKNFAVVDAGMTELMRPALYQAFHKIEKLNDHSSLVLPYDIVGPICESSDVFGKEVELPILKRNDYLLIRSAGAYGEVMASNYNLRELQYFYYR
ncbi:MAG: diaminopimelate decarboxylase [Flavobacteriia bacterium]|nr:diaminopimelate decarboxylase [Flavobacteriia bacterium]OJX39113.1 MAG: diaminopimelate decarboxylase [Flavobacteriia bacterium 40-80]